MLEMSTMMNLTGALKKKSDFEVFSLLHKYKDQQSLFTTAA